MTCPIHLCRCNFCLVSGQVWSHKICFHCRLVISARKNFRFDAQHWRKFFLSIDECSRFAHNIGKLLFVLFDKLLITMLLEAILIDSFSKFIRNNCFSFAIKISLRSMTFRSAFHCRVRLSFPQKCTAMRCCLETRLTTRKSIYITDRVIDDEDCVPNLYVRQQIKNDADIVEIKFIIKYLCSFNIK